MAGRGLYFALTEPELKTLRRAKGDPARRAVIADFEERWPHEWLCETDKAWPHIASVLRGHLLNPRDHPPPIELFFCKSLHKAHFYVMQLFDLKQLAAVIHLLKPVDEKLFRALFADEIGRMKEGLGGIDPFLDLNKVDYAWHWLAKIKGFLPRALEAKRPVIFTAEW